MIASRPKIFAIIAPIVLAFVGMGFSIHGWYREAGGHVVLSDLLYKALRSIGLSDAYADVGKDGQVELNIARWIGVIVAFWAVLTLFYVGLRRTRIHLTARFSRRHIVVVGDTPFADHLSEAAAARRVRVIQLRDDTVADSRGRLIQLPYAISDSSALIAAHAGRARRLVIAVADDAEAADLAMAAQRRFPHIDVATRMADLWLARSLHSLPGAETLRAFTEANAAAREIVRRHPPFLTARDLGQARIHSVLVGAPDWIEALMVEIILSACTLTFGKPAFTLICADADGFRERLFARYPDLSAAAFVSVYPGADNAHAPLTPRHVEELTRQGPVTGLYCASDDEASSLAAAVALRHMVARDAYLTAPIFVRISGQGMERPTAGSRLAAHALVPFGALSDIARATGIISVHGEQAEKAWHKAYLAFAPNDKAAAKPWAELSEEFRVSNQRAVGHMYAKLFEAGFDLRGWLATHDPWEELPSLAQAEAHLWRNAAERTRLAELEHERWIADRRMSGWVSGGMRDNARKIHDNIVPFDALSDELKAYDYQFVDLLDKVLKRRADGMQREK